VLRVLYRNNGNSGPELSFRDPKARIELRRLAPVARERLDPARGVATAARATFTRARLGTR